MITSGIAITVTGSPITNHQSVRLSIRTRNGPSFRRTTTTTTTTTSARLGRLFPVVCITNQHYYHHHHHPPPRVLKGKNTDTLRQRSAWWTVDGGGVDSGGITMKEGRRAREIRAAPTRLSCQSQWTNGSGRQSLFEREGLGVRFCVVI